MSSMLERLRSVFESRTRDGGESLSLARFQGICDAFEQLKARVSARWPQSSTASGVSERALVLYALAAARMQIAEQIHGALRKEIDRGTRVYASQLRRDLDDLTGQIDVLALAAGMELAQANATAGAWEQAYDLRNVLNPPPGSERGEDTLAHARARYNGGLVLLMQLQQQLQEREAEIGAEACAIARVRLAEAQHLFDTVRPIEAELRSNAALSGPRGAAVHEELEARIERMIRLLESAAAELAVPRVTETAFWQNLVTARSATVGSRRDGAERFWEHDVWCMTSRLFEQTHRGEQRANAVLQRMWNSDPDPTTTWALFQSVKDLERQEVIRATGSFFNACPWTDIWRAQQTVRVGNRVIQVGQEFCLHIEAEPNGAYAREVIVGDFRSTDELDYCDTDEGHA